MYVLVYCCFYSNDFGCVCFFVVLVWDGWRVYEIFVYYCDYYFDCFIGYGIYFYIGIGWYVVILGW